MNAVVPSAQKTRSGLSLRVLQPTIGAEIENIDLRLPVPDELRDELRSALLKYKVLFFRNQDITSEQQADFARRFGALYTHPSTTNSVSIPALHNIAAQDLKRYDDERDYIEQWDAYHTDTSWRLVPTWAAVLRAVRLPGAGGDTVWVDAGLAYEGLPENIRTRLEGLYVTHDFRRSLTRAGHYYPLVSHPVVRTHRETGARILWVNFSQNPQILGIPLQESRELLVAILDQYRKPEHQVRFGWEPGSVAFWDNRSTVHYAVRNYGEFPRLLNRVLISDEPLYADL